MATNVNDLLRQAQEELDGAKRRQATAKAEVRDILDAASRAGRANLMLDEPARTETLFRSIDVEAEVIATAEGKVKRLNDLAAEDDAYLRNAAPARSFASGQAANASVATQRVRVTGEQQVYRNPVEHGTALDRDDESSFLSDLYATQVLSDPAAAARLERHGRQVMAERADLARQVRSFGTGAVPGFAPPQYLADEFALYARAGRPAANLCRSMPLMPDGMTVNIPRVTTPTATGVQTAEGNVLTNQDPASTLLTVNVNTVGGYVQVSRQALQRGTILESVVTGDLAADYNARLDSQVLTGTGSSGQHLGILNVGSINSVVFTQASPTVALLWPKLVSALSQVWTGRYAGPTAFVMSPKVWAWIVSVVDTAGRPLVEPEGVAYNPTAVQTGSTYSGQAGVLFGVPVWMDGNLPDNLGAGTNESRVIVANFSDVYLFEDSNGAPVQMKFEAPAAQNLQVLLVAYGYSAFAAGRQPKAISVVSGTGMIVPAL